MLEYFSEKPSKTYNSNTASMLFFSKFDLKLSNLFSKNITLKILICAFRLGGTAIGKLTKCDD